MTGSRAISYPTAQTLNGRVVLAQTADRTDRFVCLGCEQPMVLRRGKVKRPHFAHQGVPPTCNAETVLHSSFKHLLHERLQHHLDTETPLPMTWTCFCCRQTHEGSLLKAVSTSKLEYSLGTCRPDLCLFDAMGQPSVMIEVVVTHAPALYVYHTCVEQQLQLLIFELHDFDDLERLQQDVLDPNWVSVCKDPTAVGSLKYRDRLERAPSGIVWDADLVWEQVKASVPPLLRVFLKQHCWITGFYPWKTWIGVDELALAKMARRRYVVLMSTVFGQVLGMPYDVDFTGYPNTAKPALQQSELSLAERWQHLLSGITEAQAYGLVERYATLVAIDGQALTIALHSHLLTPKGFGFLFLVLSGLYPRLAASNAVLVIDQATGHLVPALSDLDQTEGKIGSHKP